MGRERLHLVSKSNWVSPAEFLRDQTNWERAEIADLEAKTVEQKAMARAIPKPGSRAYYKSPLPAQGPLIY